jgi:hypothetical protein
MSTSNSVDIVHAFWDQVWNAHDPAAVDRFVVDDFVIVTGGETITSPENFKRWIAGGRVASRWLLTGKNNGFLGTEPDQQDIEMTGTAVWAVREDGKLLTNWVERASWEVYQRLTAV